MDADSEDLDSAILDVIDRWRDERKQEWTADDDGRRTLRIADRLAELLHSAAEALQPPIDDWAPDLWSTVRELVEDPDLWSLAKEGLQINLAWKIAPHTAQMADRCRDVTRVIIDANPGERVLRYVRRLTSCYIAGFFPECVIIARAVVERALKDAFDRTSATALPSAKKQPSLKDLIEEAYKRGWLTGAARVSAHDVRIRGNKAVHEDPELVSEVRDTVYSAILVIRELTLVD